ncbi:MAG: four helix bundle protein, partial [Candidatus Omnitrophica bacterium]|nr:four helix bundle protein [Candidatus Omnitrophota bacterium]
MTFLFEKLDVYRKSLELAKKIHTLTSGMSPREAHLADQARRAASSVPLNIAEGNGRWHKKERKNLFLIARGSCCECVPLL